jgi:hypothetical protein
MKVGEGCRDGPQPIARTVGGPIIGSAAGSLLRGHLKTGQRWSLQNRPTESGLGLSCFTLPPRVEASLFSCANSVDRI